MPDPSSPVPFRVALDLAPDLAASIQKAARRNDRSVAEEIVSALRAAFSDDAGMAHIVESLDALIENHPAPDHLDAMPAEDGTAVRDGLKRRLAAKLGGKGTDSA